MTFDIVFLLSIIVVLLFGIITAILAYPGPKDVKKRH